MEIRSSALPPNRSISLPSKLHPTSLRVEAELNKLRTWESRMCSSSEETLKSETIQIGLVGLAEAYRSVEDLIYSSSTQHALLEHAKVLEDALDHSVKLIDTCGIVREMQQKMKEHVLRLQLSFRRGTNESRFQQDISCYIQLRKKLKKDALKCIRSLKRTESRFTVVNMLKNVMVVKVLREVNTMASRVFRSVLLFLSSPESKIKSWRGGCSLISKMKRIEKAKKIVNEVGSVDDAVFCVVQGLEEVAMADRKIENLVISIDCVEKGLDSVFRRLIHYRVSILNVLTR